MRVFMFPLALACRASSTHNTHATHNTHTSRNASFENGPRGPLYPLMPSRLLAVPLSLWIVHQETNAAMRSMSQGCTHAKKSKPLVKSMPHTFLRPHPPLHPSPLPSIPSLPSDPMAPGCSRALTHIILMSPPVPPPKDRNQSQPQAKPCLSPRSRPPSPPPSSASPPRLSWRPTAWPRGQTRPPFLRSSSRSTT
jgi:hypothetical protein